VTREEQQAWFRQWESAGPKLDRIRALELASLSAEDALRASDALLSLVEPGEVGEDRLKSSGLVEQQRLFHQRRK
jgi:hypothetical protein